MKGLLAPLLLTQVLPFLLANWLFCQDVALPTPTIPVVPSLKDTINFQVDDPAIYSTTKIIQLRNIAASEIEPFINRRLSKFGAVQVNDRENLLIITDREPKVSDLEKLAQRLDVMGKKGFLQLETEVVSLQFVKPSSIVGIAKQRLSSDGTVQANDDLMSLIITDVRSKIERFKEIVRALDTAIQQVLIEVRIVELKKTKDEAIGFDWVNLLDRLSPTIYGSISKSESGSTASTSKYYTISASIADFDTILNLLDEKGDIKIIAAPRLVTLNNKTGSIFVGTSFLRSQQPASGIRLQITPTIGHSGWITVEASASIGEVAESPDSIRSGYYPTPRFSTIGQETSSTVLLKDKETFVMSGFTRQSIEKKVRRFPVLGYILPWIFSRVSQNEVQTELLVFITPQIVQEPIAKQEELQKLQLPQKE